MPELNDHLQRVNFDPSLLAFQWFVCFFTYNLPIDTSLKVWDLFMLKGVKVLFNVALAIMQILKKQLMETEDFGKLTTHSLLYLIAHMF